MVLTTGALGMISSWLIPSPGLAAVTAEMRATGEAIVAAVPGTTDADFDRQRAELGRAVAENRVDEETARRLVEDVDLRQAARHTHD